MFVIINCTTFHFVQGKRIITDSYSNQIPVKYALQVYFTGINRKMYHFLVQKRHYLKNRKKIGKLIIHLFQHIPHLSCKHDHF